MAKKTKEVGESVMSGPRDLGLDSILDGIRIDGGKAFTEAEEEMFSDIPLWVPTGAISLDFAIGGYQRGMRGGVPIGRAMEISGPESSAKSTLLDHIIREVLKMGGAFFLCDPEHAHLPARMRLIGCDLTNFRFIEKPRPQSSGEETENKSKRRGSKLIAESSSLMVLEEFFEAAESMLINFRKHVNDEIPVVIALDSLAAIETRAQAAVAEQNMKDKLSKSDVMSQQFGGFCSLVTQNYGAVILVNQLRSKPGVTFGDPTYSPGGQAKDFFFSLRLRMNHAQPIKAADDWGKNPEREYLPNDITGIQCSGKIIKSKVAEPFRKFRFPLFFDERGILDELAFAQLLIDREKWAFSEKFEKTGNTYHYDGEKLGIGEKGIAMALIDDPRLRIQMEEELFMSPREGKDE
jgi:recombination protein RecA